MEEFRDWCVNRLIELNTIIERGKGEWGTSHYVKDEQWARLHGQRDEIDLVMTELNKVNCPLHMFEKEPTP
jgi:hypothetical protein